MCQVNDSTRIIHIAYVIYYIHQLQSVPLVTEPGSYLIILPLMRILQRNLQQTCLIV